MQESVGEIDRLKEMGEDYRFNDDIEDLKELLILCLQGNSEAIMYFQEVFGVDIYNFPVRAKGADMDEAAEFYCYCFEKGKIFKRLLTYKGLCSFRTYQYHILNHLYTEWKRGLPENPTESLNSPLTTDSDTEKIDLLEDATLSYTVTIERDSISMETFDDLLSRLSEEERVYIKLLVYHELGFEPADIRLIAKISKKPINEILDILNEIDHRLCEKDEEYARRLSKLDEIESRILTLQRKLKALRERDNETNRGEIEELERKLQWRYRQKSKLLGSCKKTKVGLSYRDIAILLSVSVGTVSAKMNNAKKKFLKLYGERK